MKFKRLISLLLCSVLLFSSAINVSAFNINLNANGEVIQVPTDTDQFFNVVFADVNYEPSAEQVYELYMGQRYDMWRYSGGMNI